MIHERAREGGRAGGREEERARKGVVGCCVFGISLTTRTFQQLKNFVFVGVLCYTFV